MEHEVIRTEEGFTRKLSQLMQHQLPCGKCVGDAVMLVNIAATLLCEELGTNRNGYTNEEKNRIHQAWLESQMSLMAIHNLMIYNGSVSDSIQIDGINKIFPMEAVLRCQTHFFESIRDMVTSLSSHQFEKLKTILQKDPHKIADQGNPVTHLFGMLSIDELKTIARELSVVMKAADLNKDMDSLIKHNAFGGVSSDQMDFAYRS